MALELVGHPVLPPLHHRPKELEDRISSPPLDTRNHGFQGDSRTEIIPQISGSLATEKGLCLFRRSRRMCWQTY